MTTPTLPCTSPSTPWVVQGKEVQVLLPQLDARQVLREMDVYRDDRRTTPGTAGEMVLATQTHGWSAASVVGDLADLAPGRRATPGNNKHAFFRSVGLGLEDVAMVHALYKLLQQQPSAITQGRSP